jgi:hypothetical protein
LRDAPEMRAQIFSQEGVRLGDLSLQIVLLSIPEPLVWRTSLEATKMDGRDLHQLKYWAVNVFVTFHIFAIACWCIPIDSPLIPLCRNLVRPYFLWSGLFQSWDMFAPMPKAANTYIEAIVVHNDGSRSTWTFPRMEHLGLTEKFFKERYRKFADNLVQDETDALRSDAARYIARMKSRPGNQVKLVILIQKWSFIVPHPDASYVPEPWEQHVLLGYGVQPEDLK